MRPFPSVARRLEDMAWAFDVCGRPAKELFSIVGDLINTSAVRGGCFLLNSTTFAISRIVLGRFDAYIDVGVRVVEELPSGAIRVHLDRARSPAPSMAAVGWLETSIRAYSKYVDIVAKSLKDESDEQGMVRRERMKIEEIRALLREMREG